MKEPHAFVQEFNEAYHQLGMNFHADPTPTKTESMNVSAGDLAEKKCLPCEGGVPMIESDRAAEYVNALEGWSIDENAKTISRKLTMANFVDAIALVNKIADLAEQEQHHPDLHVTGYRHLNIVLTTHAIGGLSENDFILAAKINELVEA